MSNYLDNWKNRCEFNAECVMYHQMDYECALDQKGCVLYGLYKRIKEDKEKKLQGVLETIVKTDGTAWLG